MNGIVQLNNISYSIIDKKVFGKKYSRKNILNDISFNVKESTILGIAGESGSGKTTLAKIIAGLLEPTSGSILKNFNQNQANRSVNPVQILFQNSTELINPLRKVEDILRETTKSYATIKEIFKTLNLPADILTRRGYQLSGGERQRVALGRLLTVNPQLLILDEPFSAQDFESQINFSQLLKKLNDEKNITIICISHNVNLLKNFTDEIVVIYGGQIMEMGGTKELMEARRHPYTKFLLGAENYKLTKEDFLVGAERFSSTKTSCPYLVRCTNATETCNNHIEQLSSDALITNCNNPIKN